MPGLTIGTNKKNVRLFTVACFLVGFCFLNLIPISFGILGSIWPIAPIWAIGAWANDGPSVKYALVLFAIGILMDAISAANLGVFASVYILTYGAYLLKVRFWGHSSSARFSDALILAFIFVISCFFAGIFAKQWPNIISLIVPLSITIALYQKMVSLFVISGNSNE